jgi:V/A-type H+-transporting ATPase subunit E
MSDKLQELTDRLYQDGVEKARNEAEAILAETGKKKEEIIRKAENDAAAIVEKGRRDAAALKSKTESELAKAARQAEGALKQRLINLLTDTVLITAVKAAMSDEALLNDLIIATMGAWAENGEIPEISLVLGDDRKGDFSDRLKTSLKKQLDQGIDIVFSDRMKSGFRVESKDGSYTMSFTEQDFQEFFRSFIKDKTRNALFGDN